MLCHTYTNKQKHYQIKRVWNENERSEPNDRATELKMEYFSIAIERTNLWVEGGAPGKNSYFSHRQSEKESKKNLWQAQRTEKT